jgi:hypothetical protein
VGQPCPTCAGERLSLLQLLAAALQAQQVLLQLDLLLCEVSQMFMVGGPVEGPALERLVLALQRVHLLQKAIVLESEF